MRKRARPYTEIASPTEANDTPKERASSASAGTTLPNASS